MPLVAAAVARVLIAPLPLSSASVRLIEWRADDETCAAALWVDARQTELRIHPEMNYNVRASLTEMVRRSLPRPASAPTRAA